MLKSSFSGRRKAMKTQGPANSWSPPDATPEGQYHTPHQSITVSSDSTYPQGGFYLLPYPSPSSTSPASTSVSVRSLSHQVQRPLIPYLDPFNPRPPNTLIFPLPADHLLTLVQYNVLRATLTNMTILSILHYMPAECGGALACVPSLPCIPGSIPPSLAPTALVSNSISQNLGLH